MRLNLLDLLLLLTIFGSMIAAAIKGFTYEVLMMLATVAGLALAAWKYRAVAARWPLGNGTAANVIAFVVVFVAVLLLAMLAARLVRGLVRATGLGGVDRLMGAGLGLVRGVLIAAAVLMMLVAYPFEPQWVRASRLSPWLMWASRGLAVTMPAELQARFDGGLARLEPPRGGKH